MIFSLFPELELSPLISWQANPNEDSVFLLCYLFAVHILRMLKLSGLVNRGHNGSVLPTGALFALPGTVLTALLHVFWNADLKGAVNTEVARFGVLAKSVAKNQRAIQEVKASTERNLFEFDFISLIVLLFMTLGHRYLQT